MRNRGHGRWGVWAVLSAAFLLLFSLTSFTSDQVITAFGPEKFVRGTGAPQRITRTFALPSRADNHCTLLVQNGDSDKTRVTSATLTLDGATVVGPADFKKTVAQIKKAVVLKPQNTLTVELAGKPSSFIVVSVTCPPALTPNTPPVANAGPDQTATVGTTVNLDGSGSSDANGDTLTYAWSFVSRPTGSTATLSSAATFNPSFILDKAGTYVVQLIVNDSQASSTADRVIISTLNSAPVAHAGSDQTARVTETAILDGSGSTDVDGDALTYRWTLPTKPTGSAATLSDSARVDPSFVVDKAGKYEAQLTVNDGAIDSAPDSVTVTTENSPPVADAGPDRSVRVAETVALDGSGSTDVDGDSLTYQWSLTSIPAGSTASLTELAVPRPAFVADKSGQYLAQLIVHDGAVASAPDTVTISTLNTKPVAEAGPAQTVALNSVVRLDGGGSADADGDPLTYQWALPTKPASSSATLSDATVVDPSFIADKAGTYAAQLIVNDGQLDSDTDTVTISTENSRPVANAGPDQQKRVGDTVALDGSTSADADGDPLTYRWSLTTQPDGSAATLGNAGQVQANLMPDLAGDYVAQLIVNDGTLDSEPDSALVTVTASTPTNRAPEIKSSPATTATVGQPYSYDVDAIDLDADDKLTYSLSTNLDGMTIDATTGLIQWTPGQVALANVVVRVTDLGGLFDEQNYAITISAAPTNQAPTVDAGSPQTITLSAMANLAGTVTDDGLPNPPGAVTVAWSQVNGPGTVSFANLANATTTATFSSAGVYVLRLTASDGVLTGTSDVTITVNAGSDSFNPLAVSTDSSDPLLFKATASDGTVIHFYGNRDSQGIPISVTHVFIIDENGDERRYEFDGNSRLTKMIAPGGTQISLNWLSSTTIALTAITADGATQIHTTVDPTGAPTTNAISVEQDQLSSAQVNLQTKNTALSDSQEVKLQLTHSPQERSKILQSNSTGSTDVMINVVACGIPENDASVFARVYSDQTGNRLRIIPAKRIGEGLFSASIPNRINSVNWADSCRDVANGLDIACEPFELPNFSAVAWCANFGLAVASTGVGVAAAGEITAACTTGLVGLEFICSTIGAGAHGGPSMLEYLICNAPEIQDKWTDVDIRLIAEMDCLPHSGHCLSNSYVGNSMGPFPPLKIDLGSEPYITIKLDPEHREANQGYNAITDVSCVPANTQVDFSVSGTDGYEKSESRTQSAPTRDGNFTLSVPGVATHGISDTVTFTMTTPAPDEQTVTKQAFTGLDGKLSISDSLVNLFGKLGERKNGVHAFNISNTGRSAVKYHLWWWNQPPDYFGLSPTSGVLQPQGSQSITASFRCPLKEDSWRKSIGFLGPSGNLNEIEYATSVGLTCSCDNTACCGRCCEEGETPKSCCPGQKCANGGGDPHLTTFDGLAYDFQAAGEFILAKSLLPNDTFEVQIRTRPWWDASVIQATAMNVAGDRVGIYSDMNPDMRVNGVPTELAEGGEIALPLGGKIVRQANAYTVSWPDESRVRITDGGSVLYLKVSVPDSKNGQMIGLLGNADDNRQNDITIRDGASLGTQIEFTTLYPSYADSWRISQQGSLFDYAPGETTGTFTDRDFPRVRATAADFPTDVRGSAERICRDAGITDPILLENCILDVALTGDIRFAQIPSDLTKPQEVASISEPPSMSYQTVQFRGKVYDDTTGQPLNAGQVSLTVDGNPLPHVTIRSIGSDGTFETDLVPSGPAYQLEIKADGYVTEKIFDLYDYLYPDVRLVPTTEVRTDPIVIQAFEDVGNSKVLPNLNVFARRYINQRQGNPVISAVTDQNGFAILQGLAPGHYTLELQREGYITEYISAIAYITSRSPIVEVDRELGEARFRIVLTWGESPSDLDSHLTGPDPDSRFHIYYGYYDSYPFKYFYLDRDDASGFGPETIKIDAYLLADGIYRYSVHDYSNRSSTSSQALAQSGAQVEVYEGDQLIATYSVPNQEGTLWTVFEIDSSGRLFPINHMSYPSSPTGMATDYWQILSQRDKN